MAKQAKITVSEATGLTPTQEEACTLLASGSSVTDVATKLDVSRTAIYQWQRQTTFKVYFNKQRSVIQSATLQGLFGMATEAITAIRDSLHSEDEKVRLKAATYIVDKLQGIEIGQTDIIKAIEGEATKNIWGNVEADPDEYKHLCSEYGVKDLNPQDYVK